MIRMIKEEVININYTVSIENPEYVELIKEYKASNIIRNAIALQFQNAGMTREFEEMEKHNWLFKEINVSDSSKLIYRCFYSYTREEYKER